MSKRSDDFEELIAQSFANHPHIERAWKSVNGVHFSDVLFVRKGHSLIHAHEVKMNITDNLCNTRVFFKDGIWQGANPGPVMQVMLDAMNRDANTALTVSQLSEFTGIPLDRIEISSNKGDQKKETVVKVGDIKRYFAEKPYPNIVNRYLFKIENYDVGYLARYHYFMGKHMKTDTITLGDNFFKIHKSPLGTGFFNKGVPLLNGEGRFAVRIATRSEFSEVQPEIKFEKKKFEESPFSIKPGTRKRDPFEPNPSDPPNS